MRRPRFQLAEMMIAIAATGLALGAIAGPVRFPIGVDEHDGMVVGALLVLAALAFRRLRPVLRRARFAELARRYAPPPRPAPIRRLDHSAFLESRAFRGVRAPRPILRSRP